MSAVAVAGLLTMIACDRSKSDNGPGTEHGSLKKLVAALAAGDSIPREDPFRVRPFVPFPGKAQPDDAVAYGCYRAGQAPGQKGPTEDEILQDLRLIAEHWSLIRVYGADDDTRRILETIAQHRLPIRVMLGIWLEPEKDNPDRRRANIDQVTQGIELANRYRDIVITVSVGNETQVFWSGHRMAPANLIRYIRAVRAGVTVPITTADDYNFWNKPESRPIAAEIDYIVMHAHPLWNGKTLDNAIDWLDAVYDDIAAKHPDRTIVLGETGWATAYDASKTGDGQQGTLVKGEVGLEGQAEFLIRLHKWVESKQVTTFLFEAFDEPWKGGGEQSSPEEIEKHWGVYYQDRTPKESFLDYLDQLGNSSD